MTEALPDGEHLHEMPLSERREALENLVLAQFKTALLMEEDEDLPLESGFFDLGLTSLRLIELRQQLERRLGLGIDATVLFNRPTIDQLVTYLLREFSTAPPAAAGGAELAPATATAEAGR